MGNTVCQTPCASLHTDLDLCSLISEAQSIDAEYVKTPRVEPLHHSSATRNRCPGDVPPLQLRRPGETYREQIAMANILAKQTHLKFNSPCSFDSVGGNEAVVDTSVFQSSSHIESFLVKPFGAIDEHDISNISPNFNSGKIGMQLPRLHLRQPGETYREHIAMAKVMALPPETSRSDWSAREINNLTLEPNTQSSSREPLKASTAKPESKGNGNCQLEVKESNVEHMSMHGDRIAVDTLTHPSNIELESNIDTCLQKTSFQLPMLKLRQPGETYREHVAMAKVMASPPETDRSECSARDAMDGKFDITTISERTSATCRTTKSNPQDADTSAGGHIKLKGVETLVPRETLFANACDHFQKP